MVMLTRKEHKTAKAVFQYLEVISRTGNCSFSREELNMQQILWTISVGSCRHPVMPLRKQQHVNYATWCSDFESWGWPSISAPKLLQNFMYCSYFCSSDFLQFNSLLNNIDYAQRVWQKLAESSFGNSSDSTLQNTSGKFFALQTDFAHFGLSE